MGFSPGPGGGGGSIASASDVTLNSVQDDQVLTYDSGSAKWMNDNIQAGGAGQTSFAVASNANGTWPTFQSVYPSISLPLPLTSEVKWYVRSDPEDATIPSQFEDVDASSRPIGGMHSIWGYPLDGDGSTGGGSIAFVKQTTGNAYGTSITVNHTASAGADLVLAVSSGGGNTITDTAGNTWTLVADTVSQGATGQRMGQVYRCLNAAAITSVTINRSSNASLAVSLTEWSGIGAVRNMTVGATAADPVSAQVGDLVLSSIFQYSGSGAPTATPGGYTGLNHAGQDSFVTAAAYRLATTSGAQNPDWNNASIGEINIAFSPAG